MKQHILLKASVLTPLQLHLTFLKLDSLLQYTEKGAWLNLP